MSARKLESTGVFPPVTVQAQKTELTLPPDAVRIRKNGIEFRTGTPIPIWTEMTMDVQSPRDARKVHCTGVVVACNGNRHAGYHILVLFTNLSRQSQTRLSQLAVSRL